MLPPWSRKSGFSLVELLVAIAAIGMLTAVGIPVFSKINEQTKEATAKANAKNVVTMSATLASLGVAHVIPESMGGVEATARLLREGIVITEGPMAGEYYRLGALTDDSIEELAKLLRVQYDMEELRLVMRQDQTIFDQMMNNYLYCLFHPSKSRIEKFLRHDVV